ncbi:MAG: RNA-binding protein [Candidatus Bathyarchaeota archaeon]|nr:MAG: RNA-binding protein [Candidatus Bathyarchaeota archaeon]
MPTFYENRQLVTPGDLLAEGNYLTGDNTYKENDKIYSTRIGLVNYKERRIHVTALKAFYVPQVGDIVIGRVAEVGISGWMIDINAPYPAVLRASDVLDRPFRPQRNDLPSIFNEDDLLIAKVVAYDRTRDPMLTVRESGLGKVTHGLVVKITPTKIPRVIGRKGSMISMLKRETECRITLGQNGLVLISGKTLEDEQIAAMAIRKIEEESHTSGLTDRITQMVRKEKGGVENT